jgi:hypothetical protein
MAQRASELGQIIEKDLSKWKMYMAHGMKDTAACSPVAIEEFWLVVSFPQRKWARHTQRG